MAGEDFVHVRLTKAGETFSGGCLHIGGGNYHYDFKPGETKRVTRAFDWERVLKNETTPDGEPLFELATGKEKKEGSDAV